MTANLDLFYIMRLVRKITKITKVTSNNSGMYVKQSSPQTSEIPNNNLKSIFHTHYFDKIIS